MDKRSGRKVMRKRKPTEVKKKAVRTLDDALKFVLNVKRAKNLKERTLRDYKIHFRYFGDWLTETYGENMLVEHIDLEILREYVVWCSNDKEYYGGHPYRERFETHKRGLSPVSVNVRIRILKAFFMTLYTEGVLPSNPAANLSVMKTDDDTIEPLTKEEIGLLLKIPDQDYFAQFRKGHDVQGA
ncbi:phage integrase SAM-like domain-containing protein [Salicibibacter cibi]|uniref:Phage integrase SAM-like domain-containing protein n=1 Tax=Salicibibacter cibi TaxID=2743001 RepID=A0A7T6Z7Y4_9BACI|nr:phage integrase SAM-like domain-containing protein [Salicibibacter cibi]QQK78502.1 phage integrase SAM-like domain-containing protein [Salicibibacter cibi]